MFPNFLLFVHVSVELYKTRRNLFAFLFQNEQQQVVLERVIVQLNDAQAHAVAIRNIIPAIVEELVGQEDNVETVSFILF